VASGGPSARGRGGGGDVLERERAGAGFRGASSSPASSPEASAAAGGDRESADGRRERGRRGGRGPFAEDAGRVESAAALQPCSLRRFFAIASRSRRACDRIRVNRYGYGREEMDRPWPLRRRR